MSFDNITPLGPKSTVELAPIAEPKYRAVDRVVVPMDTSDGAGVNLRRSIGSPKLQNLDPFLMLDEFKSDDVRSKVFWVSQPSWGSLSAQPDGLSAFAPLLLHCLVLLII